jgi:hypothetical protein
MGCKHPWFATTQTGVHARAWQHLPLTDTDSFLQ